MIADTAFTAWLLDSFIAFTALLMFVLAVRRPVAQWLGPQVAYMLWLLPAARWFVPPLMLPDALRPFAMRVPNGTMGDAMMQAALPVGPMPPLSADIAVAAAAPAPAAPAAAAPVMAEANFDLASGALLLWGCTALLLFALLLQHHHRVIRAARKGAHELGKVGRVRLMESPNAGGPLAVGLRQRTIFIPATARGWSLDAQQMAVAHEVTHHRAGHLYHNHAAMLLLCLNWFNPVAWIAARAFIFDQEADCDARTLGRYRFDAAQYAQMLVAATTGSLPSAAMVSPRANLVNKSVIVRRIGRIAMREKTSGRRLLGTGLVILSGVALVPLTASLAQADSPAARPSSTNNISTTTTVKNGNTERRIIIGGGKEQPTYRRDVVHNGKTYKVYTNHDMSEADIRKTLDDSDKAAADAMRAAQDALRNSAEARADAAEARRDALHAAAEAQRDARQAAREAQRDARQNAEEARRDALIAAEEARRETRQAAWEAQREARAAAAEARASARSVIRETNRNSINRTTFRAEQDGRSATVVIQRNNRTETE
ncbi:hypothetical protein DMP17_10040 [Pseudonocardia sp. TMWB2A]|uniref:M56 family metallopeptidase n=1 Tax=Pseudonocardia sp. TMWB2A TaxID=687430 RepID=UPI00307F9946